MSCGTIGNAKHEIKDANKGYVWITWTPIPNVEASYVQDIAKFAVEEYNKKYKEHWKFKRIQQGWYSVMEKHTQYRFLLEQDQVPPGDENVYEAVVSLEQSYVSFPFPVTKNLMLFIPYFNYSSN